MGIQVFKQVAQQRARMAGERNKLLARSARDAARIAELEEHIKAFNVVLRSQGVDIDPDDFKPVVPHPAKNLYRKGQRTRLCLSALRLAKEPLTANQVLAYVIEHAPLRFTHPHQRYEARRGVKNQLGVLARKGMVVRVGQVGPRHDDEALWRLGDM
jgi:hypothetical protein